MPIKQHQLLEISYLKQFCDGIRLDRNPQEVRRKIEYLLNFYSVINFSMNPSPDLLLFRARLSNEDGFPNISDIGIPPAHKVTAGRLNEPRKPALYVSKTIATIFDEVNVASGCYVQVAAYKPKGTDGPRVAIIGDIKNVFRWGSSKHLPLLTEYFKKTIRELASIHESALLSYIFTDSFLSDLLTDEAAKEAGYIHTQSLAELLYQKHPNLDGICYEGVSSDGGWNLAIRPTSAERLLEIETVWLFKINHYYGYGLYDHTLIKSAKNISKDGTIIWDNTKPANIWNNTQPD